MTNGHDTRAPGCQSSGNEVSDRRYGRRTGARAIGHPPSGSVPRSCWPGRQDGPVAQPACTSGRGTATAPLACSCCVDCRCGRCAPTGSGGDRIWPGGTGPLARTMGEARLTPSRVETGPRLTTSRDGAAALVCLWPSPSFTAGQIWIPDSRRLVANLSVDWLLASGHTGQ